MKTKNIFIILCVLLMGGFSAQNKVELTLGYGTPSLFGAAEVVGYSLFGSRDKDYDDKGVVSAGIFYVPEDSHWSFGGDALYELLKVDGKDMGVFSILPTIKFSWLNPENKFQIYSGAGAGFATGENMNFAFNITPIGMRYGGAFGGFFELNGGFKGIVQAGFFGKF